MEASVQRAGSCEPPSFLCTPERPTLPPSGSGVALSEETDDAAIFVFDTVDRVRVNMLTSSPSAMAILTPQRSTTTGAPVSPSFREQDIGDYDVDQIGPPIHRARSPSARRQQRLKSKSAERGVLADVTHLVNTLSGATPMTKLRFSNSSVHRGASMGGGGTASSQVAGSSTEETFLFSMDEMDRLRKEKKRLEKMYEHQKALYEEMRDRHTDVYRLYQQKILETIALSTRLEVSKSIIRQQKKDTRPLIISRENNLLKDIKREQETRLGAEREREEYKEKYERLLEEHKSKLAAFESLHKDLSCMLEDNNQKLQVWQLDSLLKASYSKTTALFSDLMRQRRLYGNLVKEKMQMEKELIDLRKEKRESEMRYLGELTRRERECERVYEQSEQHQKCILHLRQLLIRAIDPRSSNSSGYGSDDYDDEEEEMIEEEEEEDEDDVDDHNAGVCGSEMTVLQEEAKAPPCVSVDDETIEDNEPTTPSLPLERRHTAKLVFDDSNHDTDSPDISEKRQEQYFTPPTGPHGGHGHDGEEANPTTKNVGNPNPMIHYPSKRSPAYRGVLRAGLTSSSSSLPSSSPACGSSGGKLLGSGGDKVVSTAVYTDPSIPSTLQPPLLLDGAKGGGGGVSQNWTLSCDASEGKSRQNHHRLPPTGHSIGTGQSSSLRNPATATNSTVFHAPAACISVHHYPPADDDDEEEEVQEREREREERCPTPLSIPALPFASREVVERSEDPFSSTSNSSSRMPLSRFALFNSPNEKQSMPLSRGHVIEPRVNRMDHHPSHFPCFEDSNAGASTSTMDMKGRTSSELGHGLLKNGGMTRPAVKPESNGGDEMMTKRRGGRAGDDRVPEINVSATLCPDGLTEMRPTVSTSTSTSSSSALAHHPLFREPCMATSAVSGTLGPSATGNPPPEKLTMMPLRAPSGIHHTRERSDTPPSSIHASNSATDLFSSLENSPVPVAPAFYGTTQSSSMVSDGPKMNALPNRSVKLQP